MRRRFYLGGGLVAVVCGAFVFAHVHSRAEAQQLTFGPTTPPADSLADPDIVFSENPEQAATDKAIFEELVVDEQSSETIEEPFKDEPQPLPTNRTKYLELLRRKAELMTDEQINAELQEVTADIGELEADRKLEHIMSELQALVSQHPNSVAGQKARRMVETATMPVLQNNGFGAYSPAYGERAPTNSAPSRASDDDAGYNPSPSRPTPADGEFRPRREAE